MDAVKIDQDEILIKCITELNRQESLWDESQQRTSDPEQPFTICPPTLSKDDTEVTGAKKHHLKIEKQLLGQERRSSWKMHHDIRGADYEVPIPAAGRQGQKCPAGRALQHPVADSLMEYATVGCPTKTGK